MEHFPDCPVCALGLTVIELPAGYVIQYRGKAIYKCPECGAPLSWKDGKLLVDQAEGGNFRNDSGTE